MAEMLAVRGLSKRYPQFCLRDVSFTLEEGYIMGFIGRNGAGKTTTIKAMLNMIRADGGTVEILGRDYRKDELELRREIGVVLGAADFYPNKKLSAVADVTRRFYPGWNEDVFRDCLKRFKLEPEKRIRQLSQGMRVKFSIALALSHDAKLLIMDEPTSGLDPVSRDELLELMQNVIQDGRHSILFSTHITSDLEKCADSITYIKEGGIVRSCDREEFLDSWRLIKGGEPLAKEAQKGLIGYRENHFGFTALAETGLAERFPEENRFRPTLEEIMVHMEREPQD